MGYSIITVVDNKIKLIDFDIIKLSTTKKPIDKLKKIYQEIDFLIKTHKPREVALEAPFYGKNIQSMLKLGRAQGIAISAALNHNLSVYEYAPKKIKMAVTGKGNASKEQVASMLKHLLQFDEIPEHLDATDALAVAVCHALQRGGQGNSSKNYKNWKSYITENPGRLKGYPK